MQSHKTAGTQLANKSGLLVIDSGDKFQISTTHL